MVTLGGLSLFTAEEGRRYDAACERCLELLGEGEIRLDYLYEAEAAGLPKAEPVRNTMLAAKAALEGKPN